MRQHGVVTTAQLRELGLAQSSIEDRVAGGRLHRIHRGVYVVGLPRVAAEGRWMAAVLSAGEGALLSHRSAAVLWDLRSGGGHAVEVIARRDARTRKGLVIRQLAVLPGEATTHRGIPVTTPSRTILDLASALTRRQLENALRRAEMLRLFDLTSLDAAVTAHRRAPGRGELRRLLYARTITAVETANNFEDAFLALCDEHGLPTPRVNVPLLGYRPDFLWPRERLIVETDGRASHGTAYAFEADRRRDADLAAAGYQTLRFTYRQVTGDGARTAEVVRAVLTRRGG
jgi:very-short-patch-repair endonuclease